MKPSNSAVFGSTLHAPQVPDQSVRSLTRSSENEILKKLLPILESTTNSFETGRENLLMQSFYISQGPRKSDESLERLILANVFAHPRLDKFSIYKLCKESIMTHEYGAKHVIDTVNQVRNTLRPSILYIPRIDAIKTDCKPSFAILIENLGQLQGKPVIVLASSSERMSFQTRQRLGGAFRHDARFCVEVGPPNAKERSDFLQDVFFEAVPFTKPGRKSQLKKKEHDLLNFLQNLAVEKTEGNYIEEISKFRNNLLQTCAKYFNVTDKAKLILELNEQILKHSLQGSM